MFEFFGIYRHNVRSMLYCIVFVLLEKSERENAKKTPPTTLKTSLSTTPTTIIKHAARLFYHSDFFLLFCRQRSKQE